MTIGFGSGMFFPLNIKTTEVSMPLHLCMDYQQLGDSSLIISRIGLGCMSLDSARENTSIRIIHQAVELGINYFDTADLYQKGLNEVLVGKALQSKRKEIILATKVGNQLRTNGSGWDWNPRKEYIIAAVEKSLSRLQTDYIDLYQLHGGTIDDPIDETIEAFESLKKSGKIREYGISSIRPNVIREYVMKSSIISVMMQYNLADRRPEESVLSFLKENNISVLIRGSLAQGLLVGKTSKDYLGHTAAEIKMAADAIDKCATEHRTATQTAIRFVLQHPAVTSVVVGVSKIEQLIEVAGTTNSSILLEKEINMLKGSISAKNYTEHM
jgi:aryl-alcohol dehydrogenase-like predicted oxidoreductase